MSPPDTSRNSGLQAGRAIAALVVAYYHSYIALRAFPETAQLPIGPLKDFGYLGVNLFFAISGYVICLVAARPNFSPVSFAIRRIFRLYPMYWAAMAAIALLIAYGKYRVEPLGHFLYSMTLLPQQGAAAYDFSWTLERELVFYAIAAIAVPMAGIPGLALALAALAAGGWWFGNPWSYHLISTTQGDFLAGVIVFLLRDHLGRLGTTLPILFGATLLAYTRTHDFAFSVPISFACILAGLVNWQIDRKRLAGRITVALGDASYSIYLLHYIVFVGMVHLAVKLKLPAWFCEPWRVATLAVCCMIAFATWKLIEQPMIRLGNHLTGRSKPTGAGEAAFNKGSS